jgi:phosphatidylserine/phosphatidylglycerophosphate/cardiolipin synthase-like enzyme
MRSRIIAFLHLLILFSLILGACSPTPIDIELEFSFTAPQGMPPWLTVYFTQPGANEEGGTLDEVVVRALDAARVSIDLVSFDFNLPSITRALGRAQKRGVKVRLVVDQVNGSLQLRASDAPDGRSYDALRAIRSLGIPMVNGGRSSGLMHSKFIIIDQTLLFTGSWNLSANDTYRNDNNLLAITSQRLIANYQAKFNEMFQNKRFGAQAKVGAQFPLVRADGFVVSNYFSTPDDVMEKLIAHVNRAQKSIDFMAFTYTHPGLAQAMLNRARAGVAVRGIIENRGASRGALVPLACAGLPVRLDGNKATMHHKVIIIDQEVVITGSFNFTGAADSDNDENVVIVKSPAVASKFINEMERVYNLGRAPDLLALQCP